MEEKDMKQICQEALELLHERSYLDLQHLLSTMVPADIAILMDEIPEESLALVFRILPKETAAETFVYLDGDLQEILIQAFSDNELKQVIDELFLDDTVDIIEEMPANVVKRILKNSSPDMRKMINEILNYPKDSAGSIMTIEYVDLKKHMTVEEAFARIRKIGVDKETIYTCYVTDANRVLEGLVTVKDLLLSDKAAIIDDIMETNVISVHTLEDKEDAANLFNKYDLLALPVVDKENRIVGIVTVDDAIDVIQEETEEDFAKMAAITSAEESYFKTSAFTHAKHRIVWLLFLMLSATITGTILTKFEHAIAMVPLLVSFIPMLMDTSGNCGAQASTLIIRGLALNEIKPRDIFKVLSKEIAVAGMCAIALSVVNFARILIMYGTKYDHIMVIASVVSATLFLTVIIAKLIGCSLPLLAKAIKLDPAMMASPLITTIVDACAMLIYFFIATSFMDKMVA